jgi:hypothetical protein
MHAYRFVQFVSLSTGESYPVNTVDITARNYEEAVSVYKETQVKVKTISILNNTNDEESYSKIAKEIIK